MEKVLLEVDKCKLPAFAKVEYSDIELTVDLGNEHELKLRLEGDELKRIIWHEFVGPECERWTKKDGDFVKKEFIDLRASLPY